MNSGVSQVLYALGLISPQTSSSFPHNGTRNLIKVNYLDYLSAWAEVLAATPISICTVHENGHFCIL